MPCALLAAGLLSLGLASPPRAEAFISSDGDYTLLIYPESPWTEAEISVAGDYAIDVGPPQKVVRFEGTLEKVGPLWVTISAVQDDGTGIMWTFPVDPEVIPMESPRMKRLARRSIARKHWWWPWGRR